MRNILFLTLLLVVAGTNSFAINTSEDYVVGEGDVLRIMVYDNPDLETVARVSGDGKILFPLVGEVHVDGLSVAKVSDQVARMLSKGYLVNPQVSVFIEEFRSKRVTIVGQVNRPGLYELSGPTTLMELISKAGGLTPDAGSIANIKRVQASGESEKAPITVNLTELLQKSGQAQGVYVMDKDNIFIPKAGVVYVTGQVNRPNAYKLEEGTSVIQAITMAGGFTELASEKRIKVIRKENGKEKVLEKVPLHMQIFPDDVVVVPESFF